MAKVFRTISNILSTVTVSVAVILAILLVGVRLIGFTPYTVLSGSMEPTYHVGSLIYVKKVNPATLKAGDPVTYHLSNGTVVTHRIVEVLEEGGLRFRTKGDANESADFGDPLPASHVIGKPCFTVPYLGYLSHFLSRPQGLVVVLCGTAAVVLISFMVDALFPKEKKGSGENKG